MRVQALRMVQGHYTRFEPFLVDGMKFLGFGTSRVQKLIGNFMEVGPQDIMVQAQRGQAKTTIAALFCAFSLLHNPSCRVLILSAGEQLASDISGLVGRLITSWEVLACLKPDRSAGDRTSATGMDVHYSLKGVDKSPSVRCLGVTANLAGNRADLLLVDDVESLKNADTQTKREFLLNLTNEFANLVVAQARTTEFTTETFRHGRTIWLGTPQTGDSIYNTLPGRGVTVRVWPGRFPTEAQEKEYGDTLAPEIVDAVHQAPELRTGGGLLGDMGKPTDPELRSESTLQQKELQIGKAAFMLQYMLSTRLTDAGRFPLRTEQLVYLDAHLNGFVPVQVVRGMSKERYIHKNVAGQQYVLMAPQDVSNSVVPFGRVVAFVDPAAGGANADETAFVIGTVSNSTVYVLSWGGVRGGYSTETLELLAQHLCRYKLDAVAIEKNMGYGAFSAVFTPIMQRAHVGTHSAGTSVTDVMVTGHKEKRIINVLAPVIGRGSLVFTRTALEDDHLTTTSYELTKQKLYSGMWQLSKITEKTGCLVHDDRVDALAGLVSHVQEALRVDQDKQASKMAAEAANARIQQDLRLLGVANVPEQRRFRSVMREL